jgi:hypothetical protein
MKNSKIVFSILLASVIHFWAIKSIADVHSSPNTEQLSFNQAQNISVPDGQVLYSADGGQTFQIVAQKSLYSLDDSNEASAVTDTNGAVITPDQPFSSGEKSSLHSPSVVIVQEAENYFFKSGTMGTFIDGLTFNNRALQTVAASRRGGADFIVNIPINGVYIMWGRIKGFLDGWANSFYVSVDYGYANTWDFNDDNIWVWEKVTDRITGSSGHVQTLPVSFNLTAGQHVITIGSREYDSRIDRFILTNNSSATFYDKPSSSLQLVKPPYGEIVSPGKPYEIKWNSVHISDKVNIDLSLDRGNTFAMNIATATENDGSFIWNVPKGLKLGKVVMRISDAAGPTQDMTWGYFAIIDPLDPRVGIFLLTCNGGEILTAGSEYSIKWRSFAFNSYVHIYYSTNNGVTWKPTGGWYEFASAGWKWLVPNEPSTKCLIKVADAFDGEPFVISNSTFTILPPGPSASDGENNSQPQLSSTSLTNITPSRYELGQNYPNPFNPATRIPFSLPEAGYVKLTIYDLKGQEIETLIDGHLETGLYQIEWNASDKPTGVYFAKLTTQQNVFTQKMLLIK